MPHRRVCTVRHLLARALPWAGLLTLSMSLAGAMNLGVTRSLEHNNPIPATTWIRQYPTLQADTGVVRASTDPCDGVRIHLDSCPGSDDGLTATRFQRIPVVLKITVHGPNASPDVYCDITADRSPFEHIHVQVEDFLDVYDELCSRGPPD
jgi:hypothetical protein